MGSTVLITGATTGIGRATAISMARNGHRVFVTGRKLAAIEAVIAEAGAVAGSIEGIVLDVTDATSIAAAKEEVDRRTGGVGLDVLINNAGYGQVGPVLGVTEAQLRAQYDTNVFGLLAVTRAFTPAMIRRRQGRIINVSSVGGRVTTPFMGVYTSTKYALESLSDALRVELAPFGVGVVIVEPGYIRTKFADTALGTLRPATSGTPWEPFAAKADEVLARFEATGSDASVVAIVLERAATTSWPRARYLAPWWAGIGLLASWLPAGVTDRVLRMALGLGSLQPALAAPVPAR
jgi:NAD(P)-dependent dehydrogenase (short-subunit alcohol dehydrogenase family)